MANKKEKKVEIKVEKVEQPVSRLQLKIQALKNLITKLEKQL